MAQINKKHKDRLFRKLFGEEHPENLLSLYNALNNSNYKNVNELEITTLEDVIYMGMKNDVSFIIDDSLTLIEHQSTFCPNMPLRGLCYLSKIYEGKIKDDSKIYSSHKFMIPRPSYYVMYNGEMELPERLDLKLSDLFLGKNDNIDLECIAHVININYDKNKNLLNACKILGEYAKLVSEVRKRRNQGLGLDDAVNQAVDECIRKDILKDFLLKNKAEVTAMFLTDYDEEKTMQMFKDEAYEDGVEFGLKQGSITLLFNMVRNGKISRETAMEESPDKSKLAELLATLK